MDSVKGDRLSMVVRDLLPKATYYFKIQARNSKGYGNLIILRFSNGLLYRSTFAGGHLHAEEREHSTKREHSDGPKRPEQAQRFRFRILHAIRTRLNVTFLLLLKFFKLN